MHEFTPFSRQEIVRRLLGTATQLFLDDCDPISVHCLASSAAEHASHLSEKATGSSFTNHILITFPQKKLKEIRKIRNQYWVPIKHSTDQSGQPFAIESELSDFQDDINDHTLFVVWYDYSAAGFPLPIEVQAFQVWYLAMYPNKLDHDASASFPNHYFGDLSRLERSASKAKLIDCIGAAKLDPDVMGHQKTDIRSLIL